MDTVGRNDPCPCGSGKKYKNCCGVAAKQNSPLQYERVRRYDGESTELITAYATERYGKEWVGDAYAEYTFSQSFTSGISDADDLLERWFVYDWCPDRIQPLAGKFLSESKKRLDADLARFIESTLQSPYSFYQILEVERGTGLTLRDILRKREIRVRERAASQTVEPNHILYARVVEFGGLYFFMGTGSQPLTPPYLDSLLQLRLGLEREKSSSPSGVSSKTLLKNERVLRHTYFESGEHLRTAKPKLCNTDGEEILFHKAIYGIPSFIEAFHALKDLEQNSARMTDEEMLAGATRNSAGEPEELLVQWLKKSEERDNTIIGTLTIKSDTLIVEVNSEKRYKKIQRAIEKRLGERAVLRKTEIMSAEEMMKQPRPRKSPAEAEQERILRESPEVRAHMKTMMDQHWAAWFDTPIPALRGMTPRAAAKDSIGRELLESLLMDFESKSRMEKDEFLKVDVEKLRKELRMERRLG